jgi:hypothetical protein
MSLWHGPTPAGGAFAGGPGARRGDRRPSEAARSGGQRDATRAPTSHTSPDARGGPRRAGDLGPALDVPAGRVRHPARTPPRCWHGPATPGPPLKAIAWHIPARVRPAQEALGYHKHGTACSVLGAHIGVRQVSDAAVMAADRSRSWVEGGVRSLTAPLCCVASPWVEKPSRTEGLVMAMPLALLLDAVARRRMRQQAARRTETVPHHSNQPTASPT